METTYTFREITSPAELMLCFKLRYSIYENSRVHVFLNPNDKKIDMDIFDVHSRHYGLFVKDELAGYLRIVVDRKSYSNPDVLKLGLENGIYNSASEALIYDGIAEYPFLSYQGVPEGVQTFYHFIEKKHSIIEASRIVIADKFRSIKTAFGLIECAVAAGAQLIGRAVGYAILDCCPSHAKVYNLFGFRHLPGVEMYYLFNLEFIGLSLSLSPSLSDIPARLRDKIQCMLNEFQSTGKILRNL